MPATTEKTYTLEEYFELERTTDIRHEFVYGILIPVTGESKKANRIATNCMRGMADHLEERGFEIFVHDVRLMVDKGGLYRYPDLVVAPVSDKADTHAVTQPVLIIEVLSDSTAERDRGAKLREYTRLPSLHYYLLISQAEKLVELYSRKDDKWVLEFYDDTSEPVPFPALDLELAIEDIYHTITFP